MVQEIIKLYNDGLPCKQIAEKFKLHPSTIWRNLKKNNIALKPTNLSLVHRKYEINDKCFEKIDEPWKAYFLGWIWTDGCLSLRKGNGVIKLALAEKDKGILDYFNLQLYKGKKHLIYYKTSSNLIEGRLVKKSPSFCLSIYNKEIVNNLMNLGLVEKNHL